MIATQIQAIVSQLSVPMGFVYGTANELNAKIDKNAVWPCAVMYNIVSSPSTFTKSNAISNNFALQIKFVYKSEFADDDTAINEAYASQAMALANEFLVKLANYRISSTSGRYFKVKSTDKATISPVYKDFDINAAGVKLTLNLSTMFNDNVALPKYP